MKMKYLFQRLNRAFNTGQRLVALSRSYDDDRHQMVLSHFYGLDNLRRKILDVVRQRPDSVAGYKARTATLLQMEKQLDKLLANAVECCRNLNPLYTVARSQNRKRCRHGNLIGHAKLVNGIQPAKPQRPKPQRARIVLPQISSPRATLHTFGTSAARVVNASRRHTRRPLTYRPTAAWPSGDDDDSAQRRSMQNRLLSGAYFFIIPEP